jgi:predicted enzyme related to lactoylglutathione lyase
MADPKELPALVVKVEGTVRETNIDAYRDAALARIESINTALATDEDFVEAEGVVKWCGDAEKKIKEVKAAAMEQAADINAVFTALDEISGALRDKRLSLNKQVKAQKEERKQDAIESAIGSLVAHVEELSGKLDGFTLPAPDKYEDELTAAAKGKKTLKTLNKALDKVIDAAKAEYTETHARMTKNAAVLDDHKDHAFLFADADDLVALPEAELAELVKTRIAEHEEAEQARLERERESLREEVREEERAKLEEEAAAAAEEEEEEEEEVAPAPDERAASRDQAHTHHAIDYIEIGAVDIAASKAFYSAAFGWKFTDYGPDNAGIQGDGREPGGLAKVDSVGEGGPLIVLYSDDLDATYASVRSAGGEITEELFEFPGGRQFHFHDPSGNELAVWSDA